VIDHWSVWRPHMIPHVAACALLGVGLLGSLPLPAHAATPESAHGPKAGRQIHLARAYAALPLRFEVNSGQTDPRVRFLARGAGYTLFLTPAEATLALAAPFPTRVPASAGSTTPTTRAQAAVLRLRLDGANPRARVAGQDRLPGVSNYLSGRDPRRWQTGVHAYARVTYHNVLPGIDQVYYSWGGRLEYDFVLTPGADPRSIRMTVDGAGRPRLDARGGLEFQLPGGILREARPVAYQQDGRVRQAVSARYVISGQGVSVGVGGYDRSRALTIDPALAYATYLGGSGTDDGSGIAVDSAGDAYVTGTTSSTDFPTQGPEQGSNRGVDTVFVSKLNPTGSALLYSTYLGGSGGDAGYAVAVDGAGDAYVTGSTNSTDFPVTAGAPQGTKSGGNGNQDAFVAELNPTGDKLLYGTYLGGSANDAGQGIAVDSADAVYVTGYTYASDFPTTTGAYATTYGGGEDAFVTKIITTSAKLAYSTYLGGSDYDVGAAIAVDGTGDAYVTGGTGSSDFPTRSALFPTNTSGDGKAFVTELNPNGSGLLYSTYLGGTAFNQGAGIAVDGAGDTYVTGYTSSTDFPTTSGAYAASAPSGASGTYDAFVAKLNAGGGALGYSTYLGGTNDDRGAAIAVDGAGDAYVTGSTASTDFPTTTGAGATTYGGGAADAFLTTLNAAGSALTYSTYLGGAGEDYGYAVAVDCAGSAYVTGQTSSANRIATTGAYSTTYGGGTSDAFVAKIGQASAPTTCAATAPPTATPEPGSGGLYATGLGAVLAVLLYRRRRSARGQA